MKRFFVRYKNIDDNIDVPFRTVRVFARTNRSAIRAFRADPLTRLAVRATLHDSNGIPLQKA